eukprot:scaffold121196_cov90-Phaeocystis_antarctica.AAC.1
MRWRTSTSSSGTRARAVLRVRDLRAVLRRRTRGRQERAARAARTKSLSCSECASSSHRSSRG